MEKDYGYVENFKRLGLGMFVHFGLYSAFGKGEWYSHNFSDEKRREYEAATERFEVDEDWARELVATAKAAGCKYINITTRHHDGFSLYDTRGLSDFDAPHSACGRDLVAELVRECNRAGLTPFFYHTLIDWHEPSYKNDFSAYVDYLVASVEVLCKNYGKVGGFWFDGYWDKPDPDHWQFDRLYGTIRKYQPTAMIINNTGLSALGQTGHREIDSVTFERGKPFSVDTTARPLAGEVCEGLTDHWGYASRDICVKSTKEIVKTLVDCRYNGCNLLINSGPKANGKLTEIEKYTLLGLGKWIEYNDGFIYGAEPCEITADGAKIMRVGDKYYAAIDDVPMEANANVARAEDRKRFTLRTHREVLSAKWLDNGKPVRFDGNVATVDPFEYGTSLGVRVAEIELKKAKIGFLGDSITAGAGAGKPENMYTTALCKLMNATEMNYGVGGTRVAAQSKPSSEPSFDENFIIRAKKADPNVDFTFVFGGTNDYGHGDAPMGEVTDDTDYTFSGALNNLLRCLTKKYGADKLCYILPLRRYRENDRRGDGSKSDGEPLSVYRERIKEICKKFGVDCIDICDVFPEPQTPGDDYTVDGLHPNPLGHRLIAERLAKYLKSIGRP